MVNRLGELAKQFILHEYGPGRAKRLCYFQPYFRHSLEDGQCGRNLDSQWLAAVGLLETLEITNPQFAAHVYSVMDA